MKKVLLTLVTVLFVSAFVSCEQNKNAAGGDTKVDSTANAAAAATSQTPPEDPAAKKAESLPRTTIKFETETFDFKKIKEGDEVPYRFNFTNTGTNDLFITNVKPSCGCTTPTFTQEAVKPGQKGFIDVKFNSSGKSGVQKKSITVTGNFEGDINKMIYLTGEVLAKETKPSEKEKGGAEKK